MRKYLVVGSAMLALALPHTSQAQIAITPQIGVFIPANSLDSLKSGAQQVRVNREGNLALGFALDLGFLRGSLAYASAATLNQKSTISGTESEVGKGKLLALAGDIVIKPIPSLLVVRPYLLAGAGVRRSDYDYSSSGVGNAFPSNVSDFALHAGVGVDVMLGPVGISGEITDFISKDSADAWKQHDGFGFVGLKLKM